MTNITKTLGVALFGIGMARMCFGAPPIAPEIDPATGANALVLLVGALLVVRSRRS